MTTGFEALCDDLDRVIGENADDAMVTRFIDTGYEPLNEAISGKKSGGLPQGRLVEVYGESQTGKTALATKWMVEAQRMGGVAGFVDWERSFNIGMATRPRFGLNDKRPHWLYFKPKTWEEGNMLAGKACRLLRESGKFAKEAPILFVFDSIAAAIPKSTIEKEMDELSMNDTTALARVTSTTLKTMASIAEEYDATFVYLNQVRLKPGVVYGDPRTTPGGKAMEFYASARVALGRQKITETKGGEKEFVGQVITAQVTKSKFTKPFKEASMRLAFDEDDVAYFDMTTSLIEYCIDKELLSYSKPRVTWPLDGKQYFVKQLAEKITKEGLESELRAIAAKVKS